MGLTKAAIARPVFVLMLMLGAILIGFNALLWVFLPFYLRNGFYTVPEFLKRRYGTAARLAFAGLMLAMYIFVEMAGVLFLGLLYLVGLLGVFVLVCVLAVGLAVTFHLFVDHRLALERR